MAKKKQAKPEVVVTAGNVACKPKPLTPYLRLLKDVKDWASKVRYRHRVGMFYYPKPRLNDRWSVLDLYERTKAAEQLGYDVRLQAKDDGLHVEYVKRVPDVPYGWQD